MDPHDKLNDKLSDKLNEEPGGEPGAAAADTSASPGDLAPLRLMLVAGEPSGDALGAGLIDALKTVSTRPLEILGVGGPQMEAQGLTSLCPMSDLAVMGLAQVAPAIPKVLGHIKHTVHEAMAADLDAIILIDSSGFTDRIASRLKKRGFSAPIIKYVAPQVWASRPWRVHLLKNYYDHILTLYPFEPPYFQEVGLPATFVGHPLTNKDVSHLDPSLFCERHGIMDRRKLICLLPGSRTSEVKSLLPLFRETIELAQLSVDHLQVVVPTTPNVHPIVEQEVKTWPIRSIITTGDTEKYLAFKTARAALAASGTVSLELAMCGTPSLIAYKVGWVTATIFRPLIKTKYLSLINIVADEEIIPEFVQETCHPQLMARNLTRLLNDDTAHLEQRRKMLSSFATLRSDGQPPSIRAAQTVLDIIGNAGAHKQNADPAETGSA